MDWLGNGFDLRPQPKPSVCSIESVRIIECRMIHARLSRLSIAIALEPQLRIASLNIGPPRFTQINSYNF